MPKSGQIGYITCAVLEGGGVQSGGQNQKWPKVGRLATQPVPFGGPQRFRAGEKVSSGPHDRYYSDEARYPQKITVSLLQRRGPVPPKVTVLLLQRHLAEREKIEAL